jgi:thioredoxin-related protein
MRSMLVLLFLISTLSVSTAGAYELLMFRRTGCPWCAVWDREIKPIYPNTEIGRRAPIKFVDLDATNNVPYAILKWPVRFSPTFVLIDQHQEIGRIEGYPGEDFFWGLLENLLPKPIPAGQP